jgi:hypothetical protein
MARSQKPFPANDNGAMSSTTLALLSPIIDLLARQAVRQIPAPANDNVEVSGEPA